jgi:hypothetical protein
MRRSSPRTEKRKKAKDAVVERIKRIEDAITKGTEYLESGKHADWKGFRPLFYTKIRNGKELPPHRDWVKNFLLPRWEKALIRAEKLLGKLS